MARRAIQRSKNSLGAILAPLLVAIGLVTLAPDAPPAMASNCPAGISLTAVHGTTLYWDKKGNDNITGAYLGYRVENNTGSVLTNVVVQTNLGTTGNAAIKRGGGQPNSESLGSIAAGDSAMAYFLVDVKQGSDTESVSTTLNYNSTNCSLSENLSAPARRALAANANKLFTAKVVASTSGTTGTAPSILKFGSFATVVVTGNTGTIGSGPLKNREVNLTPVVYPGLFAADAWKLVDVSFKSANTSCGVSGLIANRIHISSATSPSSAGCGGLYSASFTFQSREVTKSSVSQVQAFSYIASGNLIKHTSPLGNTIGLPTVNNSTGTATTKAVVDLDAELSTAISTGLVGFTAEELSVVVYQDETITAPAPTFVSGNGPITNICLVNPANSAVCDDGPYTVKNLKEDESNGIIDAGTFRIVQVDGEDRVQFSSTTYAIAGANATDQPARIVMRLTDSSDPVQTSDAFANATVVAGSPPTATGGTQTSATQDPLIFNVTATGSTITKCLFVSLPMPDPCSGTVVSANGTWTLNGNDTVTFVPVANYVGTTTIYFGVTDSLGATVFAPLEATITGPPTATTNVASSIAETSAVLNGLVSTNGLQTSVKFCWGTEADLDSCTEVVPSSSPLAGSEVAQAVSQAVTGLTLGTQYYFRVIANNGVGGDVLGNIVPFITVEPPVAITEPVADITGESATLKGKVNPKGNSTTADFCLRKAATPGENPNSSTFCDSGTTSVPVTEAIAGPEQDVTAVVTGLEPNSEYVYQLKSSNSKGVGKGSIGRFSTSQVPPIPVTEPATGVSRTSAKILGTVNPKNKGAKTKFCWGVNSDLSGCAFETIAQNQNGNSPLAAEFDLTELTPGQTYYYRIIGNNGVGGFRSIQPTSVSSFGFSAQNSFRAFAVEEGDVDGSILNFTTLSALSATTSAATSVTSTSATLNGSVNPGGESTTAQFCISESDTLATCISTPTAPQSPLTGSTTQSVSANVTGLTASTTYYFRVSGTNSGQGTVNGLILSFTTATATSQPALSALTDAATLVTKTSSQLNGSVNPGNATTTVTFCYGTSETLTGCTTVTASQSGLTGTSSTPVSAAITGLTPLTTYYFRVLASNATPASDSGLILSFTTQAALAATTTSASSLTSSSATVNGTVNPGGESTTVSFCFGTSSDLSGCQSVNAAQSPLTGSAATAVSASLSSLLPSTTYYFRVLATNPGQGTQNGSILSFVTLAAGAPATPSVTPVTPPATVEPAPTAPTVRFDLGDEGSEPTILEVTEAGLVLPEPETIKPGHTFGGWLIDSTIYQPGETLNPSGNVVAKAIWVRVQQVGEAELADTGFASTDWMAFALFLLAIGGSLVVYARRRA